MFLWLLLVSVVLGAAYVLVGSRHSPFNRAGLVGASGRIDAGEKFGVAIGADYNTNEELFKSLGFEKRELTKPKSCHGFDYSEHQDVQLWFDDSWRKGTLCVVSTRAKVVYVSWSYGVGFP